MIGEKILGAWELESFIATLEDGRQVSPFGRHPEGSIVYTRGYVSVNMARGGRARDHDVPYHASGDDVAGPLARNYMAYSGPYRIDEARQVITHDFRFCLDPALVGTLQERHARLYDDKLELTVKQSVGTMPSTLIWRRVSD
ncbi:lipocalin-like domain-containing protein [Sphingobium sp. Sx8-8]|uniref:lipocalin-like domain-containing protein n=1 Tax=Sphingobium sp. Sx8-8 TaxID=2933617 RepID=UPI001F5615A5|nr:lipocalin-like domain-containing protein [Sphingobium sp. Sx8-8]